VAPTAEIDIREYTIAELFTGSSQLGELLVDGDHSRPANPTASAAGLQAVSQHTDVYAAFENLRRADDLTQAVADLIARPDFTPAVHQLIPPGRPEGPMNDTLRIGFVGVLFGGDYLFRPIQIQTNAWIVGYNPHHVTHDQAVDTVRLALGHGFQVIDPADTFSTAGDGAR
jgi:hypothetical protein